MHQTREKRPRTAKNGGARSQLRHVLGTADDSVLISHNLFCLILLYSSCCITVSRGIQWIMKEIKRKTIEIYQRNDGICPFVSWLEVLDSTVRHRVKARLARVAIGNLGEYKVLNDGINELKFKFGSGYRIYFSEVDGVIVLLLCGGDKKTQTKDIKLAKEYLKDYLTGEDHG